MSDQLDVQVGDEVIVTQKLGRGEPYQWRARVEKAARVWLVLVELTDKPSMHTWRVRRDTQQENWSGNTPGGGTYQARFYTIDQWQQKQREEGARDFLSKQGIRLEFASPWRDREVEMAEKLGWTPEETA